MSCSVAQVASFVEGTPTPEMRMVRWAFTTFPSAAVCPHFTCISSNYANKIQTLELVEVDCTRHKVNQSSFERMSPSSFSHFPSITILLNVIYLLTYLVCDNLYFPSSSPSSQGKIGRIGAPGCKGDPGDRVNKIIFL